MRLGDYLLVCRTPGDDAARSLSTALEQRAALEGHLIAPLNAHAWLAVRGPVAPKTVSIGGWTLIGDVFDRQSPILPTPSAEDPWAYERKLVSRIWGRYVGVLFERGDRPSAFLRDPSGALECVTWTQDGLTLACSAAEDWLIRDLRPAWRINVDRVAQALHSLVAGTGDLLIDGPTALEPGTIQALPLTRRAATIWEPADFADRSLDPAPPIDEAMLRIRRAIDEAVSGLASLPGPLGAEVSGGLDSSLVAASLRHNRPDAVSVWLNAYGSTPESDERDYVTILGRALGFKPLCARHATGPITSDWLTSLAGGFRPGLNALDHPQDRSWTGVLEKAGATALMTGKGGDSVLFQAATTDVFTDVWLGAGWRALAYADLAELAAANEISVWSMIRAARRHRRHDPQPLLRNHPMLALPGAEPGPHPWLSDLQRFGPAKRFQIAGVADSVSHHGPSALTRAIDVRHPLCAQPVVEACLALPTSLLTIGGRDRGLARRAHRDRLPADIVERRTKGEMTRVYGRMIAENLDVLRPWLADGRLAAWGVINRKAALTELTPEALIWQGQHAAILTAAAFEGWVRTWEARLSPLY